METTSPEYNSTSHRLKTNPELFPHCFQNDDCKVDTISAVSAFADLGGGVFGAMS